MTNEGMHVNDPTAATSGEVTARDAVMGHRAEATRRRLLRATQKLVETQPYRELTVSAITRHVGIAPATFYRYFSDVEDALLVVASEVLHDADALEQLIEEGEWENEPAAAARRFIDGLLEFWSRNRNTIRVIEFLADDGEREFERLRARLLRRPMEALAVTIASTRHGAGFSADAEDHALAVVLVAMLAQVARYEYAFAHWQISFDRVREALATVVLDLVAGQVPAVPGGEVT